MDGLIKRVYAKHQKDAAYILYPYLYSSNYE